jgi:superfamily II DNA or RNA helicase
MKLYLHDDKTTLRIVYDSDIEREQLEISLTRQIRNKFALKKSKTKWKGIKSYLLPGNRVAIGLWPEVKKICKKYSYPFEVTALKSIYRHIKYDYIESFMITATLKYCPKIKPRDDQFEAVHKLLMYKNCLADLGTGAGKTYMIYMFCLFEIYHKQVKKILIVCQDADAVLQYWDNFTDYSGKWRVPLKVGLIYGGGKIKEDIDNYQIVIGNFQSLQHRSAEMFTKFSHLIVDEVHRATNNTIQTIVKNCANAKYKLGLSGSILEDRSIEHYTLLETFGPIVARITQKELMDKGAATPVKIEIFILNHPPSESRTQLAVLKHRMKQKEAGNKIVDDLIDVDHLDLYHMEQDIVRASKRRIDWIAKLVNKLDGNCLVLFIDIKRNYGGDLVHAIKLASPEKEIYYVDGDVDTNTRHTYQKRMDDGKNKVMVATFQTYGTGKSINNIHYIVLAESVKGFNMVTQVFGRGMRKHSSKEYYTVFDLADNLSTDLNIDGEGYKYQSVMMKHMDTRIRHYIKSKFDYEVREVNI